MRPTRVISPELAFQASLKVAQRSESQGKATITKGEAESALKQLSTPKTSDADRARIVQSFLDGTDAAALSPKAKQVLVEFIQRTGGPSTGGSLVDVKMAARAGTAKAEHSLQQAQARLEELIKLGSKKAFPGGLAQVAGWLDAAGADIRQAKATLKTLADSAAKAAARELTGAGHDVSKAARDVQKLMSLGGVKKADLELVRGWLAAPLPELQNAVGALMLGPPQAGGGSTLKFPSDQEDQGSHAHGGGGGPPNMMHTMKYPSDNEDGGSSGGITDVKKQVVSSSHATHLRKAFQKLNDAGSLHWQSGGVIQNHLGERFASVELFREKHTDGYTFTAYLPLGALTPTAIDKDPNKVNQFYVERTGGKRGSTEAVGPLHL